MNYLAHAYLSGDDSKILIGNFIGDVVKGNKLDDFSTKIQKGIRLHRAIDYFTDTHEVNKQSRHRLTPKYRHYSGVIVDIFYDHFLAVQWDQFHPLPLQEFTMGIYETMELNNHLLPDRMKIILKYMTEQDWLFHYSTMEGIKRVLAGMSRRTKFDSKMEEAIDELKEHYDLFKDEFNLFFPFLKKYVSEYLQNK